MSTNNLTWRQKVVTMLKVLFASKRGWLSLCLAYVLWSLFWSPLLVIGWITASVELIALAGAIFLFFAQPLIPMWLIVPITAMMLLRFLKPKTLTK